MGGCGARPSTKGIEFGLTGESKKHMKHTKTNDDVDNATLNILKEAKRILKNGWTQKVFASTKEFATLKPLTPKQRRSVVPAYCPAVNYFNPIAPAGCFCLRGAVIKAHHDLGYSQPRWDARADKELSYLASILHETVQFTPGCSDNYHIEQWNDHPKRTRREVLRLLTTAIHRLEKRGVAA